MGIRETLREPTSMSQKLGIARMEMGPIERGSSRWAVIWFAFLLLVLCGASYDTLSAMIDTWSNTTTYNHGFLILPISLYLIWMRRRELPGLVLKQEPLALIPLAGAAALWLVSAAAEVVTSQEIALVAMAQALVVFCFGWSIATRMTFPLLFLFFMVPVGDFLISPLQTFTADFSVRLLRLSNVPVFRDGNLIQVPGAAFLVAEACAGLRFLIANLVVATLFSYLFYTKWVKYFMFIVIAIIVPVIANGLRAFGIIYLAYLTDNRLAAGADHIVYGWGFFSVVMLALLAIGCIFADRPVGRIALNAQAEGHLCGYSWPGSEPWRHSLAIFAALMVSAAPAYAWSVMRAPTLAGDVRPTLANINSAWTRLPSPLSDWRPQFPGADWTLRDTYRQGENEVDVFVAYYAYQRRGAKIIYYANSMADERTWWPYDTGTVMVHQRGKLIPSRFDDLASSTHHRIVVWWYWVDGQITNSTIRAKILQTRARLFGGNQAAAVVAVSVKYDRDPADAIATADRFLRDSTSWDEYLAGLPHR
jgi:exosortase A